MKIEYNNIFIHFVIETCHNLRLISEKHRVRIEKYITGIVNNYNSKLYAIYANPEHVYFLVSHSPKISEEALATVAAESSEKFINDNKLCIGRFEWKETAAAFSVSKSDIDKVCKYILNQPKHHRKVTFKEEFNKLIRFKLMVICLY